MTAVAILVLVVGGSFLVGSAIGALLGKASDELDVPESDGGVVEVFDRMGRVELVARLYDGPLDGGHLIASPGVWPHAALHLRGGEYVERDRVTMPDGGAVVSFVWIER